MRVGLVASILVACRTPQVPPTQAPQTEPARLLVYVVVDQLSYDLFDAQRDAYTGGLRRMLDTGASAVARHHHAITFTCPGHATLSTGASPSVNGIVGNEWRLPSSDAIGDVVYCANKDFLRVPTLADQVQAAGGHAVSLALKDRAAIMMGGHGSDAVAWWDTSTNAWLGTPTTPWISAVDASPWRTQPWVARRPELYAAAGLVDQQAWERDPGGLGVVFPHPAPATLAPKAFLATPLAGSALTDLAIAALDGDALGADATPDLLAISYSNVDYVGHSFTSRSWEAHDTMLALDADLGRLLDTLDARLPGQYAVVLSADHGAAPPADTRFSLDDVTKACDATLASLGLPTGCVLEEPSLWLSPGARSSEREDEASLAVAAAVTTMTGVDGFAWRAPGGLPDAPASATIVDAIRLSLDDERSGDVYVLYESGFIPKYPGSEYAGTSHGTPYDYDQLVPFLAYGAGVKPGALPEVDTRAIAATGGALIGVVMPPSAMAPITAVSGSR